MDISSIFPQALPYRPRSRHRLLLICFLIPILLLAGAGNLAAHRQGFHVLILNSYHQGYAWSDNIMEGIRKEFAKSGMRVELSFEYLDTQQHEPAKIFPLLEDLFRAKFTEHHRPFDVVIVSDNAALDFILPRRELLAPGVPVVFTGINDYDDLMIAGEPDITGVAEDFDLLATIETALALHPGTRNLAVVSDVTATGRINYQRFLEIKPALPEWLHTIELVGLATDELQEALRELPPASIILNLSFYRDPTGRIFSQDESMELLLGSSRAPIYAAWGFLVRSGALGGIVASGYRQGQEAGRMAIEILRGRPAAEIPVLRESPNVPMFNYLQMQRFGLSREDLPPGSIIVNERESYYQQHRSVIWIATLLLILQLFIITGLIVNIGRRRRAETDLRLSETRFRNYFQLGLIGMAVGTPKYGWFEVNDRLCEMLGYSREELLKLSWLDFTHPDDIAPNLEKLEKVFAGKTDGFSMEKRFIRKDGSIMEANISVKCARRADGSVDHFVSLIQDVTERNRTAAALARYQEDLEKQVRERTAALAAANSRLQEEMSKQRQTEHFLRESEEKYRSLVERANDGIFIVQGDNLRYVNPEMAALLDYAREELLGLTLDRILPADQYPVIKKRHNQRVAGEKVPRKYETTLKDKNGALIDVEFNAGLVHYEGRPASMVFVRDVRERKQLEEERAKVGKLESIGVLAGGIAHDFNNLLTGVLGNVSFARMLVDNDSKAASLLDNAENISLRARDLAQQLITFAEGGAPRKEKVNLAGILPPAADAVLADTAIRRTFHFPADLRAVEGDPDQLRQLINILVINAREAMGDRGELTISAGNIDLAENEQNRLKAGPYVKFTCTDTGRGIAPENLPRIFDPYFSTKEMGTKKGMGLGLSIAYSIVRRHEGHIEAQSRVGRGTIITVHLPAVAGSVSPAAEDPGGPGRILIVDDEPVVREVVAEMLRHLGYGAVEAGSGSEALARVRHAMDSGRNLDAVIIDLGIRGSIGADEVAQQILSSDPKAVIIAALGFSRDPVTTDYRRYGFRAAVHKPYQLREMAEVLSRVLQK